MTNPPLILLFFPKLEEGKKYHWFPYGPLSVAAPLVERGLPVRIIDERITPDYEAELAGLLPSCLCVGVSSFTGYQLAGAVRFARRVRELAPRCPVVWGGPHASALPEQCVQSPLVDACVVGYGQFVFLQAVERLLAGRDLEGIDGLQTKARRGAAGPAAFEGERLPAMPWHLLDMPAYINPERGAVMYLTSYGCPSACTFCSTPASRRWGRVPRERILGDLDALLALYPFRQMVFYDSTFLASREHWEPILGWLERRAAFERWLCDGRALDVVHLVPADLERLERSGLRLMVVGLESASPRIVALHKKGSRHLEIYREAVRMLAGRDLDVISGVIFGSPGETVDDLRQTTAYITEMAALNPRLRFSLTDFGALPGTALFDMLAKEGVRFPQSLEEWAGRQDATHYTYNRLDYAFPYVPEAERREYARVFREFWEGRRGLLA